jgi:hypothetical protein
VCRPRSHRDGKADFSQQFDTENHPTLQVVENTGQKCVAGRQGFELGARPVSNMVMARDFWF